MIDDSRRYLTLVGGNSFGSSRLELIMPEMYFNWLLKKCRRSCASEIVSDAHSYDLADAIETIAWTDDDELMIAHLGDDPGHNAIKELCDFLRQGSFIIRSS